tara:strand:+ start:1648 stop:2130 length:483 start_codon:yes stop_codon:yes gene_type:complete
MLRIVNIEHESPKAEKRYKGRAGSYGTETHPLRRIVDADGNIVGKMRKQRRQATRPDGSIDQWGPKKWVWIIDLSVVRSGRSGYGLVKRRLNLFDSRKPSGMIPGRDAFQKEVKGLREAREILAGLSIADHIPTKEWGERQRELRKERQRELRRERKETK